MIIFHFPDLSSSFLYQFVTLSHFLPPRCIGSTSRTELISLRRGSCVRAKTGNLYAKKRVEKEIGRVGEMKSLEGGKGKGRGE